MKATVIIIFVFMILISSISIRADEILYQDLFNDASINITLWEILSPGNVVETANNITINGAGTPYPGIRLNSSLGFNVSTRNILTIWWGNFNGDPTASGNYFPSWSRGTVDAGGTEEYFGYSVGKLYSQTTVLKAVGKFTNGELSYIKLKWNDTDFCMVSSWNATITCHVKNNTYNIQPTLVQLVSDKSSLENFTLCSDTDNNFNCELSGASSPLNNISLNITFPSENEHLNNNFYVNVTANVSFGCSINNTAWSLYWNNDTKYSYLNLIPTDGYYSIKINCTNSTGGQKAEAVRNFYVDVTSPFINADPKLENNDTIIYNNNLTTFINFSDNIEIYSINITTSNGTIVFNKTGISNTYYRANISIIVDSTPNGSITARVCDTHTLGEIADVITEKIKNGLSYIIGNGYVNVYPKDYENFKNPKTEKKKDRYTFEFNKKENNGNPDVFVVESNEKIEIPLNQYWGGHLIIPGLNRWIDFETGKKLSYVITRISDYKVEVTVNGINDLSYKFNSIGELNCVSKTYYYANINPSFYFANKTIASSSSTIQFNITDNPIVLRRYNATLYYNRTAYYVSNISNFSKVITTPEINGFYTNTPLFWSLNVNGYEYNLTNFNQTVYNLFLNNCSNTSINISSVIFNFDYASNLTDSFINVNLEMTGDVNYTNSWTSINNFTICIYPDFLNLSEKINLEYGITDNYLHNTVDIFLSNITQRLILYYQTNPQSTSFTIMDKETGELLSDVWSVMYRQINSTWVIIENKYSDITGRVKFGYENDIKYKFELTKIGYEQKVFYLDPILFSSYDVLMDTNTTLNNTIDYDRIALYYSPVLFYNNLSNNFTFVISSPYAELKNYGFKLTYPGGGTSYIGTTSTGETIKVNFTISGSRSGDTVRLDYHYNTDLTGYRNFTYYYDIIIKESNYTMVGVKDKQYGLGLFERMLITVFTVILIAGIASLVGQPIPGLFLGFMIFIYFVYIGFIPLWSILISLALGLLILGSRPEG